jgi:uncharacterized protein YjeT (DUF2065 family)
MDTVVKIIGIVFVCAGIVYLLKPDILKRMLEFFEQGKRIYFAGLIRFVLAIVFLLAARECDITWLIFLFGILFLISGLLVFLLGPKRLRPIFEWWQKRPPLLVRILSLLVVAFGVLIIYSA